MIAAKIPHPIHHPIVYIGLLFALGLFGCENTSQLLDATYTDVSLPDPHNHARYPHQGKSAFLDVTNDAMEIIIQEPPSGTMVEESIYNDTRSHQALLLFESDTGDSSEESSFYSIYIKEVNSNTYFKIAGSYLPLRPVLGFTWVGTQYLVFDVPSNPSWGFHYVFDIEAMEFIFVTPMTADDF